MFLIKVTFYLFVGFSINLCFAIVPLTGVIYGDRASTYEDDKFNGLLSFSYQKEDLGEREPDKLLSFKAIQNEAESLKLFCEDLPKIKYSEGWKKDSAIRSIIGTLQFVGIDVAARAIGMYANKLELTDLEFQNLSQNIVKNYCSANMTVYAHRTLLENLSKYNREEKYFRLPSTSDSPFFSDDYKQRHDTRESLKRELNYSIMNFRSLCSWDGSTDDYRLLVPYLKSPVLMSYIFDKIQGKVFSYDKRSKSISLEFSGVPVLVACEDLVCRKRSPNDFKKIFPRMIGSSRLQDDLFGIYCDLFSKLKYKRDTSNRVVKNWIDQKGSYQGRLEVFNLIALLTQIPNPLIFTENFRSLDLLVNNNIKERWDRWSFNSLKSTEVAQYYEEPLEIELISQKNSTRIRDGLFNIELRVSLSEIDKVLDEKDKISAFFNLKFESRYLSYIKNRLAFHYNRGDVKKVSAIENNFRNKIIEMVKDKDKFFGIKLSRKDFGQLLASELLAQLEASNGNNLKRLDKKDIVVPVRFAYGLFALQYIHQKFIYQRKSQQLLTFK